VFLIFSSDWSVFANTQLRWHFVLARGFSRKEHVACVYDHDSSFTGS
jgi:hypothetical protein